MKTFSKKRVEVYPKAYIYLNKFLINQQQIKDRFQKVYIAKGGEGVMAD